MRLTTKRRSLAQARADAEAAVRGNAPAAKPTRRYRHIEAQHAQALIRWRDMIVRQHPDSPLAFLHSSLNGAHMTPQQAAVHKLEGMLAGVWDYFLPFKTCQYRGLYLELKAPATPGSRKGRVSEAQERFGRFVQSQGYCTVVAFGWEEAQAALEVYAIRGAIPPHLWEPST